MLQGLDHFAIVVPDNEAALAIRRDRVGLEFLSSEVVNNATVRQTHLDLGMCRGATLPQPSLILSNP